MLGLISFKEACCLLTEARDQLSTEFCTAQDIQEFYNLLKKTEDFKFDDYEYQPRVVVLEVTFIYSVKYEFSSLVLWSGS